MHLLPLVTVAAVVIHLTPVSGVSSTKAAGNQLTWHAAACPSPVMIRAAGAGGRQGVHRDLLLSQATKIFWSVPRATLVCRTKSLST